MQIKLLELTRCITVITIATPCSLATNHEHTCSPSRIKALAKRHSKQTDGICDQSPQWRRQPRSTPSAQRACLRRGGGPASSLHFERHGTVRRRLQQARAVLWGGGRQRNCKAFQTAERHRSLSPYKDKIPLFFLHYQYFHQSWIKIKNPGSKHHASLNGRQSKVYIKKVGPLIS